MFDVAPNCVDAKLLQAELMLDDKDYGGQILACRKEKKSLRFSAIITGAS